MGTTKKDKTTALTIAPPISLTAEQFRRLAKVPAAREWLENIRS